MTTPKLGLPELSVSQAGKELTHNAALAILAQLVMPTVLDKDLTAPPSSPSDGALYIVGVGPSGAWAGKQGQLAYWLTASGAWAFMPPAAGWIVRVMDELDILGVPKVYGYTGSQWVVPDPGTATAAPAALVTDATTARMLGLADAGKYLRFTVAAAVAVTIPPQASVAWSADIEIHLRRAGAGALTLTPGAGVTLNAPSGGTLVMNDRMSVTLKRVAADIWDVIGQTVAV